MQGWSAQDHERPVIGSPVAEQSASRDWLMSIECPPDYSTCMPADWANTHNAARAAKLECLVYLPALFDHKQTLV
jgi:hypothetical protein